MLDVDFPWDQLRDYIQDLDALITSKPNNLKVEMLSMFQDHIQKGLQKVVGGSSGQDVSAEVEDAEDWRVDIYSTCCFLGGLILKKKLCILNSVHCLLELCHKPRRTSRTPNTRWFAQVWLMTTKRLWATTSSETRSDKIWMFTVFFLFFGSQKPSPRWMGIDTWPKQLELFQQFHHVVLKVFMFCCWFGFLWSSSNSDFSF